MQQIEVTLTEEQICERSKVAGGLQREIYLLEKQRTEKNKAIKQKIGDLQAGLDVLMEQLRTGVEIQDAQGEMFGDAKVEHLRDLVKRRRAKIAEEGDD